MISQKEVIERYKETKELNDPNMMTKFFKSIEGTPLPSSLAIDKARAIQLSDGNEYTLSDAEILLSSVIEIDPDATSAYMELGCLVDAAFERTQEAIDIFNSGIAVAKQQITELIYEKAKAQSSLQKYSDALTTLEPYLYNKKIESLYREIKELSETHSKNQNT